MLYHSHVRSARLVEGPPSVLDDQDAIMVVIVDDSRGLRMAAFTREQWAPLLVALERTRDSNGRRHAPAVHP